MLENMPSPLFKEWQAYARIEPFGPHRDDLRAGIIGTLVGNQYARRGHAFTPERLFPEIGIDLPKEQPMTKREEMRFRNALRKAWD